MMEEKSRVAPGSTPVRRKRNQSQTQASQEEPEPPTDSDHVDAYAKQLISGELTQRLFAVAQKIHKKLPPHVRSVKKSRDFQGC